MSAFQWDWLCRLRFGGIIFGNPAQRKSPLPSQIADGDLDGDLYWTCWNESILRNVEQTRIDDELKCSSNKMEVMPWSETWLDDGQKWMGNVNRLVTLNQLICQLYKQWKQATTAERLEDFGRAYKEALDVGKHGGDVYLPSYCWAVLPNELHQLLTDSII